MASVEWETASSIQDLPKETGDLNPSTVFDLGDEKLHVPLPPLPAWMLDTPMYSKLPMVPAPKGKIVLFTTMLCKKLHQTPEGLDFDPAAAAAVLGCEYKSLHDPHLKGHYTRPVTYSRLVKSGHITSEGMVKCTLKEFNDYHQYLKAVRLEKVTQDRQKMLQAERERISRQRKQTIRKEVSERDKLIKDTLVRQKKVLDKARSKLARKLQTDYDKTMMRLVEQRRLKKVAQQSKRKTLEEKHRAMRMNLEIEAKLKKVMIRAKRSAEEMRCTDLLTERRKEEKALREKKLEDQWNRRELARARRLEQEAKKAAEKREEMARNVVEREEEVARHRMKQHRILEEICDERHRKAMKKEVGIALRLEERLEGICCKYTSGTKRGRRRFPPINAKLSTAMTTWNMKERKQQLQGGASAGSSSERLPPIVSSDESTEDRKRSGPPTLAIYQSSSLPTVPSSDFSHEILATVAESETSADEQEAQATGDAPISVPEAIDSFTLVARQLVTSVFDELKDDPEFENVEWEEEEDEEKEEGRSEERDVDRKSGSSSEESTYIEPADVSRHASLLVMNAINTALNKLYDAGSSVDTKVTKDTESDLAQLEEEPSHEVVAQSVVSDAINSALSRLRLDSEPMLVERQEQETPAREVVAQIIVSDIMNSARSQLRLDSEPMLVASENSAFEQRAESVPLAVDGALSHADASKSAEPPLPQGEGGGAIEREGGQSGRTLTRDSVLLSSVIDVFRETPDSLPSITHTLCSSDSESDVELEDDTVIGIVENPALGPTGDDVNIDEGLVPVMQENDGKLSVEGAVLTSSSHSAGSAGEQSVTERVLSNVTLERTSGTEANQKETPSLDSSDSSDDNEAEIVPSKPSSIIPVYQKHSLDIGGGLVEDHLAAISQKPEAGGRIPGGKGKCGARNSFRNIFRPDMTYCQGSARTLRDTLVKDISSRQVASMPAGMDMVCEVLDKEEHDIMEKHSDEALVTVEETEGLCYLPVKGKVKGQQQSSTATPTNMAATSGTDTVQGQNSQVTTENASKTSAIPDKESEQEAKLSESTAPLPPETKALSDPKIEVKEDKKDDAVAMVTEEYTGKSSEKELQGAKTEIPVSKSATEATEGTSSDGPAMAKRELSAQSVDASPNLAIAPSKDGTSEEGKDLASKSSSRRSSKKVTRSSSLISGVMSRLSHVFSSTRRQSNTSCPSHESSSEPASRQTSKKSIDENAGKGVAMETAVAIISDEAEESITLTPAPLHQGPSVRFAAITIDPPSRKESIYASHRPQTPVPTETIDGDNLDDEEEEENDGDGDELIADGGGAQEIAVPAFNVETPSNDIVKTEEHSVKRTPETEPVAMETPETQDPSTTEDTEGNEDDAKAVAMETEDAPDGSPNDGKEETQPEEESSSDPLPETEHDGEEVADMESKAEPGESKGDVDTKAPSVPSIHGNQEATSDVASQGENDSNNANTDRTVEGGSKPPSRLPSINTSQLQGALSISSQTSNASRRSNSTQNPAIASGSRTSRFIPSPTPPSRRSSSPNPSAVSSMMVTGRSLDPLGSKAVKSVTSATGKVTQRSRTSQRVPSGRGSRGSQHRRGGSAKKKTSATQSAIKVMSAYGGNASTLSISGSQILPNKLSKAYSTSRRSSRTSAAPISATNLSTRSSHGNRKSSSRSIVMPRPPSGKKAAASSSSHRAVKVTSGSAAFSNPTLNTSKGSSSVQINQHGSADKLLPRRPSLEKENRLERLSTESVTRKHSSQEAVAKKKSSSSTGHQDESLQEEKPTAPMPPIKESITPRPPTQHSPSKQKSRPGSGVTKVTGDHGKDSSHKVLVADQVAPEN